MKNIRTLKSILRIEACTLVNTVSYYFKRIPWIGTILPDSVYSFGDIKLFVAVVMSLIKGGYFLLCKLIYLVLLGILPVTLVFETLPKEHHAAAFIHIMVFLSMWIGAFRRSVLLANSRQKYICVKLMRMPAKQYAISDFWLNKLGAFLGFLFSILIAGIFVPLSFWQALALSLNIFFAQLIGEAVYLLLMDRTGKRWNVWQGITVVVLTGGALSYLPLVFYQIRQTFGFFLNVSSVVTSIWFVAGMALLAVLSARYITNYPRYQWVYAQILKSEALQTTAKQTQTKARFADVTLKESDLDPKLLQNSKIAHKQGYYYLNAIFFERHKRMIAQPIWIRLAIIGVVFLSGAAAALFFPQISADLMGYCINMLPVFVFIMYCLSIGERVTRAMFNNCDISLLRYGYYRKPNVVIQNFKIRLMYIIRYNLLLAVSICAMLFGWKLLTGIHWQIGEMLLFFVCLLLLAVFFSVHHLFLYYVFQPYTTDLGMKNPLFNIINTVIYILCYICLQLNNAPAYFTFWVLGATILYIVIALILVRKFAPTMFKVK